VIKENDGRLYWEYDNEKLLIEPWGKNSLRVRVTHNHTFIDEPWALLDPEEYRANIKVIEPKRGEKCTEASIINGKISAHLSSDGRITFKNQKEEILLKEYWCKKSDNPSMHLNRAGREMKGFNGESFRAAFRFLSNDKEKLFGMGQYQMPYLDLKGCSLELAHRNSQISIPFVLSNLGYGFLWNNPAIGHATFSKNETEWVAESTKQVDYWITAGDTPAEIEEAYANVTGKVPMMPDYGMGFWQCKLRYRTQEELLNVAREHRKRGLPMDVIVVDFFHWTQQGEYKFDPKYWPDVKGMCEELKSMDIKLMVSIWPTVDYRSENFTEMMEKGYLVRTERGVRVTMQFYGQEVFFDPTHPGARDFIWKKVKKNYYNNGVHIFWLDEAEPEYDIYDYDNYRYYIGSVLEVGNIYPFYYARTFYDGMIKEGIENPLNLIRCAWAGSQRFGTLVWSGDIDSTFESLRRQLRAGLNMGIAGIPWWTTDIGGFHGAKTDDACFRQLIVRWFQYGCFSPVFRLHGFRLPVTEFEGDLISGTGSFYSGADNEVWSYGEETFKIFKKYLFIRERLKPYVSVIMKEAHEKGTPVMRPLFYEFPFDEYSWEIDDQYMFGSDILVAPVIYKDQYEREVYLPAGARWKNVWSNEEFDGGQKIKVPAPIEQIPLFTRNDANISILES
jgi:alpha-D-xyloside xylohydrolase